MGGHKIQFPEMPDFRKYNVEDVPVLLEVKKKLAAQGLHDPWLRNEVWRYEVNPFLGGKVKILPIITVGMKYGLVIAIVATVISKTFARKGDHH